MIEKQSVAELVLLATRALSVHCVAIILQITQISRIIIYIYTYIYVYTSGWGLDARLTTLLCIDFIIAKYKEVKTG
jgi:hypothetical protein